VSTLQQNIGGKGQEEGGKKYDKTLVVGLEPQLKNKEKNCIKMHSALA
jgi:hypothetical protein